MQTFLYVLHFLVCFILISVVLLQRGKGQDLGASLGGGSANTIFGSRGAGNFLTRITTASAVIFMATSLSLSYLGYKSSEVRLFEESEPFVPAGSAVPEAEKSGLEEIPAATKEGALVEIPSASDETEGVLAADAGVDDADAAGKPVSDAATSEPAPIKAEKPATAP